MAASFDFSEIKALAADLGDVPKKTGPLIRKAVEVTSRYVRDDWRKNVSGLIHAPAFPSSITYDLKGFSGFGATVIESEIGPDKGRAQGALGNLLEYGSVNNAPRGDGAGALQKNTADFEKGIGIAIDDGLKAAGL